MKLDESDLLSGDNIPIAGVCTLKPPRVKLLKPSADIGYKKYAEYLGMIATTQLDLLNMYGIKKAYDEAGEEQRKLFSVFNLITANDEVRKSCMDALQYFIAEPLVFDAEKGCIKAGETGEINESNFDEVRECILQTACISKPEEVKQPKFHNEAARRVWEAIQANKAKKKSATQESDTLYNIVSSVCACSPSYNFTNIWELTVYQLYNQFGKLNKSKTLEPILTRWAVWSQEDFDFSTWYK